MSRTFTRPNSDTSTAISILQVVINTEEECPKMIIFKGCIFKTMRQLGQVPECLKSERVTPRRLTASLFLLIQWKPSMIKRSRSRSMREISKSKWKRTKWENKKQLTRGWSKNRRRIKLSEFSIQASFQKLQGLRPLGPKNKRQVRSLQWGPSRLTPSIPKIKVVRRR